MKHMIIDGVSCEFEKARNVLLRSPSRTASTSPTSATAKPQHLRRLPYVRRGKRRRAPLRLPAPCVPKDGMIIKTNTAKLRKYRRMILELLLASHRVECTTCDQSGQLQAAGVRKPLWRA